MFKNNKVKINAIHGYFDGVKSLNSLFILLSTTPRNLSIDYLASQKEKYRNTGIDMKKLRQEILYETAKWPLGTS